MPDRRTQRAGRHELKPRALLLETLVIIAAAAHVSLARADDAVPLAAVVINGSTAYTPPELFAVYRDELGKPMTAESARAIVQRIAALYRADGYAEPQVRVRGTLAEFGVLHVDVMELRVASVAVRGDPGPYRARLESLAELGGGGVLRDGELQRALERLRRLPGLTVAAAAARDAEDPSGYRLDLDADFAPLSGTVRLTNRGTEEIGPYFMLGQVLANGLFGRAASAGVSFASADDTDEYRALGLV